MKALASTLTGAVVAYPVPRSSIAIVFERIRRCKDRSKMDPLANVF
jgi:hypothetical protein